MAVAGQWDEGQGPLVLGMSRPRQSYIPVPVCLTASMFILSSVPYPRASWGDKIRFHSLAIQMEKAKHDRLDAIDSNAPAAKLKALEQVRVSSSRSYELATSQLSPRPPLLEQIYRDEFELELRSISTGQPVKKLEITENRTLSLVILENELIRVENEITVSQLIYAYHGCDSWEDMFRDNIPELEQRCMGIQISIDEVKRVS